MIYVDVMGNFGNQLFEYAHARMIQEKTGQTICLNTYNIQKYYASYLTFNLDKYVLNENVIIDSKQLPWFANIRWMPLRIMRHFFPNTVYKILSFFGVYIWLGEKYKKINIKKHNDYYLVGFWQSEQYFKDIKKHLLNEFKPKKILENNNKELIDIICNTESVCVSIRRGNYISNPKYKKKLYLCDENYFKRAIEQVEEEIEHPTIILFSDDVEWAKNNVKFQGEIFCESGEDSVEEKLRLMSMCKHFVISNISFSWWSQYLSDYQRKKVYAPSRWMVKHKSKYDTDIYMDEWHLIDL